jgi:two-component system response regulator QseB
MPRNTDVGGLSIAITEHGAAMRILLIEDDVLIGDGILNGLRKLKFTVDWFRDGLIGRAALEVAEYDAVVLDLTLPGMDGMDMLKSWRAKGLKTPVMILTARDAVSQRVEGLNLGADDYLCKPFALSEVDARLRALIRRAHNETSKYIEFKDLRLYTDEQRVTKNGETIKLTTREIQVLELFLLKKNVVLSRETIAEKLYDWEQEISSNAIDVFICSLRKKIGNEHIKTIYGAGYRFE